MHNSRIKRISLAVCLALMPFTADAAGLGKLTVFSGLGEPLNAEIELSASSEELTSLSARIAPAETYTEQGIERPASLSALRVEMGKQANGTPVLKLTSAQPVNDPFLDMLIQMEWSTGRLLREYTALLDPPGYGDQKSAATAAPQISAPASVGSATATAVTKPTKKSAKARRAAVSAASRRDSAQAEPAAQGEGYTTRSGDNLLGVARQMQVEGVSLEQMLVGLYRTNQDAFVDQNMNRLKVGQIMRAPGSETLQSLSQQEAIKEIRVHSADWHAYRNKLAGAVAESVPPAEDAQGRSASGKITAPAEDKAALAAAGPRDVVKLSRSDTTSSKPGAPQTPVSQQDKLKGSKEDTTARDKAVKEAEARVAILEKQLQEMQQLLQVKNQALAGVQKAAPVAAEKPQPAAPAAPAPEVKKPLPAPAPAAQAKSAEVPVVAETKPEAPKPARKPRTTPPVVEPVPEASPLADPLMLGAVGGGLLALLGAGWLFLRNKRRKGLDSFEQGILTTSGLKPNTVFGNTAGGLVDTGDTSFLTDLSQGSGGMIDTNDVDPIAEAEVYMAYGRDVQAEEILKDAIGKEPRRYELHQKLLEIYANRKDATAFETLAGELYATLGATDPSWQKFAAMGRALEPENPLYSAEVPSVTGVQSRLSSTQEFSAEAFNASEQDVSLPLDVGTEPPLNLGQEMPLESPAAQDNSLDFDLGFAAGDEQPTAADEVAVEKEEAFPRLDMESVAEVPEPAADAGLDFSFELPEPASPENVQLGVEDIGLEPEPDAGMQGAVNLETLPELSTAETESSAASEPVAEDFSFDLPEFDLETAEDSAKGAAEVAESVDFELDLPEPELEVAEAISPEALPELEITEAVSPDIAAPEVEVAALETPDFSFDLPVAVEPEAAEEVQAEAPSLDIPEADAGEADTSLLFPAQDAELAAEEIVFDTAPDEEGGLDFDFDVEMDESPASELPQTAALGLPDLNLSGISLDLNEPSAPVPDAVPAAAKGEDVMPAAEEAVEEISFAADESADVDTKLDLVAAYMDMGDTEGARELLEEVVREGGPQQRDRAQVMLDALA